MPPPSSHTTVRTVPYTAVQFEQARRRDSVVTTVGCLMDSSHAVSAKHACRLPSAVPPPILPGRSGISALGSAFRSDVEYAAPDASNRSARRCVTHATTMASADFYRPFVTPYDVTSPWAEQQTSQGKTRDFPPTYPPYIRRIGPDDIGLRVYWPSRPPDRRLVCGSRYSGRAFAYRFLQIPPHDGHPCGSARSSCHQGLHRDFHPASHFLGRFR